IDMSTVGELFAPKFMEGARLTPEIEREMARSLDADSLRYLPIESIARCVEIAGGSLCQACINGTYPTPAGQELYQIALDNNNSQTGGSSKRTYDAQSLAGTAPR
ncbi:MAG: amidophosphoribosyltransferase, partial [Planctomycetaceae bacterium]